MVRTLSWAPGVLLGLLSCQIDHEGSPQGPAECYRPAEIRQVAQVTGWALVGLCGVRVCLKEVVMIRISCL